MRPNNALKGISVIGLRTHNDSFPLELAYLGHLPGADGTLLLMNRRSVEVRPDRLDAAVRTESMAARTESAMEYIRPFSNSAPE